MRNRKKRAQREEVRKILHTMRLELAARRLSQDSGLMLRREPLNLASFLKSSGVQSHGRVELGQ